MPAVASKTTQPSPSPLAATRQQIAIERYGSAETLAVKDAPAQQPGPDEVSIRVAYSGINFADVQMRLGFYPDAPKKPFVPGYEVAGVIEAVGDSVSHLSVGDRVIAGTYFGGYASQVAVPASQVFVIPDDMDLESAAALPVNFFTAQIALHEMARIRKGDKILIECATGGVGTLAIQMATASGAEVVGLTTSPAKKDYIENLGATAYTRDEFKDDPTITGFDFILNASGGSEVKRQRKRLKITGRMVCIGLSSGVKDGRRNFFRLARAALATPRISVLKLFDDNSGIYALNALHVLRDDEWVAKLTESLQSAFDLGIEPHVGRVFPAEEVGTAHEFLQTRQARGKLLLSWS